MRASLAYEEEETTLLQEKLRVLQSKLAEFKETADATATEASQAVSNHYGRLMSAQKNTQDRSELTAARQERSLKLMSRSENIEKIRDRQSDVQIAADFYQSKIQEIEILVLKLGSEKCSLRREIEHAKSDLLEHETVQRLNQTKIEFATESVAILGEEVV